MRPFIFTLARKRSLTRGYSDFQPGRQVCERKRSLAARKRRWAERRLSESSCRSSWMNLLQVAVRTRPSTDVEGFQRYVCNRQVADLPVSMAAGSTRPDPMPPPRILRSGHYCGEYWLTREIDCKNPSHTVVCRKTLHLCGETGPFLG